LSALRVMRLLARSRMTCVVTTVAMPPPGPDEDPAAGVELCALLAQLKRVCGLSYDELAAAANMARNTVISYITKPGHRRDTRALEKPVMVSCSTA
jgi:hypothetical protein